MRFSRRLLNTLWERQGTARLSNKVLGEMVGTSNPNQQVYYRGLLQQADLIQEGSGELDHLWQTWELLNGDLSDVPNDSVSPKGKSSYQPRAYSKTYRITQRVKKEFDDYYCLAPATGLSTELVPPTPLK